jgi:hypothetical protein
VAQVAAFVKLTARPAAVLGDKLDAGLAPLPTWRLLFKLGRSSATSSSSGIDCFVDRLDDPAPGEGGDLRDDLCFDLSN